MSTRPGRWTAWLDSQDQSPPARFARNVTQSARQLAMAKHEGRAVGEEWARFFCGTTSCCARQRGPPPSPTINPDVDSRVISVNGTSVPYGNQFAWVQAIGVAYLPAQWLRWVSRRTAYQ
jgi:hypothetical protein